MRTEGDAQAPQEAQEEIESEEGAMTKKLLPLPCPFCGVKPRVEPEGDEEGRAWARVVCANRDCVAQVSVRDGESVARSDFNYKNAAIKKWNTRYE